MPTHTRRSRAFSVWSGDHNPLVSIYLRSEVEIDLKQNQSIGIVTVMTRLQCLVVAQPYASLITGGHKRWEFRSYEPKQTGTIGIAASNTPPWRTRNLDLNSIASRLPRGVVLGTADLVTAFFVTSEDLKKKITSPVEITLEGQRIVTYSEPIGEPIEDVNGAIASKNWNSFAWILENVRPLDSPIPFQRNGTRSTWVTADIP